MKRWMTEHHGQTILTFQTDKNTMRAWNPGARTVDARATFVLLDESRRYYAGMKTIASDADSLMIEDDWHVIHYIVAK